MGVRGRKLLFIEQLVCFGALNICFHPLHNSKFGITNSYRSSQRNFREAFSFSFKKSYYGKIKYIKRSHEFPCTVNCLQNLTHVQCCFVYTSHHPLSPTSHIIFLQIILKEIQDIISSLIF